MIAANELRIGNWVLDMYGERRTVSQLTERTTGVDCNKAICHYGPGVTYPIPLTPEILEGCGFVEIEGIKNEYFRSLYNVRKEKERGKYNLYVFYINSGDSFVRLSDVPSLHQLQNLYFALTGEELDVKL